MTRSILRFVLSLSLTAPALLAFNGHIATQGPLRLEIKPVAEPTQYSTPSEVVVALSNSSAAPLTVRLRLDVIDEWHPVGPSEQILSIPARADQNATFRIAANPGAYSAHYPVHIRATFSDGPEQTAHAVQIFETRFPATPRTGAPRELPLTSLPAQGALLLTELDHFRAGWTYFDQPPVLMPVGWQGEAQPSRAHFLINPATRGETRSALNMHPAWAQGRGTVFVEYRLQLPQTSPLTFAFAHAIRDSLPPEPPSDGVTFRVLVNGQAAFDRHSDSKRWVNEQVDLSSYAGQEILLRLECHPGPRLDTTCDSAYWGSPVIRAGAPPKQLAPADRLLLQERAQRLAQGQLPASSAEFALELTEGWRVAVVLGPNGLVDGVLAFGNSQSAVCMNGLEISVLRHRLASTSGVTVHSAQAQSVSPSRVVVVHQCTLGEKAFALKTEFFTDRTGLRIRVESPERITDLAPGTWDRPATRVYYGHGYCITAPQAFRAGFGGHNLSTSHVGMDFDNGISLLSACDNPPDAFAVDPADRTYALHTHMNGTLTFVPSALGAIDAAKKYRAIDGRKASPGFARKAGRFVFDFWGGRYADNTRLMQRLMDYGLTDSMLTLHVWQRWGYDYRLPDIFPPDPSLGTLDDLRQLGALCDAARIPWGLHDNYIDFYPDADQFSYDQICFTETGEPVKAWINTGRDAQSYRFRPDRIQPSVERNLKLIAPALKPSHYFIDVFTSINLFDFYDRLGTFHSPLETREHWAHAFRWIQSHLGPDTITTSEAGHDQLVGSLDGADCQHLNLSAAGGYFQQRLSCRDWERFPWFSAVLHDRFSLHGAGYPGRYEGGRSRLYHGIESDDYLSDEILLGHALMIDRSASPRPAVRKYWLAQNFARGIATDALDQVQFADGDIHRLIVRWSSGAEARVNRGATDWPFHGRVLPQFGYVATQGTAESAVERIDGIIVEHSRSPGVLYVNGRGFHPDRTLQIVPTATEAHPAGARSFTLPIAWEVREPVSRALRVSVQFKSGRSKRYDRVAFQKDYSPDPAAVSWPGAFVTGADQTIEIPEEFGPGEYDVHLSLIDPSNRARLALDAEETGHHQYVLGTLVVDGSAAKISGIRFLAHPRQGRPEPRWNVDRRPVDFGPILTSGALRCTVAPDKILLTPLPDEPSFELSINVAKLAGADHKILSVRAMDRSGSNGRDVPAKVDGSNVSFRTTEGEFGYVISLGP